MATRGFLLIPVAFLLIGIPSNLRWFRKQLKTVEPVKAPISDLIPGEETLPKRLLKERASAKPEETEIELGIRSREFLDQVPWESSLDRVIWKSFTEREKVLAEFVLSKPPLLILVWRRMFARLIILVCISYLAGFYSDSLRLTLFYVGIAVITSDLVYIVARESFLKKGSNYSAVSFLSFLWPIGFRELVLMDLKFMGRQSLLVCAYAFSLILASSFLFGFSDVVWLIMAPGCVLMFLASRIVYTSTFFLSRFSSRRSIESKIKKWIMTYFIVFLLVMLPFFIFQLGLSCLTIVSSCSSFCIGTLIALCFVDYLYRDTRLDIISPAEPADNSTRSAP